MHTLLQKITARKGDLSDRAFARRLAIPPGLFADTLAGRKNISDALLAGIAGNFPDLDKDVCDFLRERFSERKFRVQSQNPTIRNPKPGTRNTSEAS